MKFHLKMTCLMLAVLSLLFGAGGSMLISISFQESLEREEAAALADYRMAWGTLQIVNGLDSYLDREALGKTMEQLYKQNISLWSGLRLSAAGETVYEAGSFPPPPKAPGTPEPGACLFSVCEDESGERCLVLSGAAQTNEDILLLTASRNISGLYAARDSQQSAYIKVFLIMCLLCCVLSYTASRLLTAPLKDLSRISRTIAAGHYSGRVRVRSEDEIGMLAGDFNAMARQLEADARQREEHLEQMRQSVERQERFVGSFAHEMKTPMTSLIGYADLIRSGTLTQEEQEEAVGYLYSEGKRLESLSRKLLELLVVRQQGLPLVPASPGSLIERLLRQLEPVYRGKGIEVVSNCEKGLCLMEPDLAWSLFLNLADNAQKSMDSGGRLEFRLRMLEDGCRVRVLDTGRGIPPEALRHLTEAFYRADKARSRRQGGFGLGLALCQEIVALHHGSMRFENRPQGGACVTVELRGGRP